MSLSREKGVDKEDVANEKRRRIGGIWPLRKCACFHELYLPIKLSAIGAWSQWSGFDLVDLKCAENNCVLTPILAYFETKSIKYPHFQKGVVVSAACGRNCRTQPNDTAKKTLRPAKSSLSTPFSLHTEQQADLFPYYYVCLRVQN